MQTQVHLTSDPSAKISVNDFGSGAMPFYTLEFKSDKGTLCLFLSPEQLREIASKALDTLGEPVTHVEAEIEATPAILCDNCHQPVESDGDVQGDDRSLEWWQHVDTRSTQCDTKLTPNGVRRAAEVKGSYKVEVSERLAAEAEA